MKSTIMGTRRVFGKMAGWRMIFVLLVCVAFAIKAHAYEPRWVTQITVYRIMNGNGAFTGYYLTEKMVGEYETDNCWFSYQCGRKPKTGTNLDVMYQIDEVNGEFSCGITSSKVSAVKNKLKSLCRSLNYYAEGWCYAASPGGKTELYRTGSDENGRNYVWLYHDGKLVVKGFAVR